MRTWRGRQARIDAKRWCHVAPGSAISVAKVHPIERLRYVARAGWAPPAVLAAEAAWALGDLALHESSAVLPACRRLLDRHPGCGPLWWVAARMLTAGDPAEEAERCVDLLESDPTPDLLREELHGETTSRPPRGRG